MKYARDCALLKLCLSLGDINFIDTLIALKLDS